MHEACVYRIALRRGHPEQCGTGERVLQTGAGTGVIPVAPHLLYPQFLEDSDPAERNLGLRAGLELLSRCEEMWVFGEEISPGMSREIQFAQERGIPIRQWGPEAGMERGLSL